MTAHNILSGPASCPPAYEFEAKIAQDQESITNGYLIVAKDKVYTPTHITGVEVSFNALLLTIARNYRFTPETITSEDTKSSLYNNCTSDQ